MSLAEFKVFQAREIDLAAEAARQQFVTPGDGMAAVYRQKLLAGRDDGVASSHVATAYVYRAAAALREAYLLALAAEVARFEADATPNPANYPLMNGRATRLGVPLAGVAEEWRAKADAWIAAASEIEDLREGAKEAIAAANTEGEVIAAMQVTWPTP